MDIERVQFEMGGHTYFIRRFEPFLALRIFGTLQKSFLASALHLLDVRDAQDEKDAVAALAKAVSETSAKMDGDSLVALAKLLIQAEYVSVRMADETNVRKLDEGMINLAMGGADDLILLCVEVVKVNYANFAMRVGDLIGKAQALREAQAKPKAK